MEDEDALPKIVDELRGDLIPNAASVKEQLARHLASRLEELYESLDFIVECAKTRSCREEALAESQKYMIKRQGHDAIPEPPKECGSLTLTSIESIQRELVSIHQTEDRIAALRTFCSLERRLEPIEVCVGTFAGAIDEMIQLDIDIARGK
jgi:hypothetical protein